MVDKEKLLKKWKLWLGVLVVILLFVIIINYNNLSKQETVEKFLYLISQSDYKQAKKYITLNFGLNLTTLKQKKLENAENFTYKYGDYYLDNNYDIAYIYINLKETKFMSIYKFKLKQTIFGYKIDNYDYEYTNY